MKWTDLIRSEAEKEYKAVENLVKMVSDSELSWKPATGKNWLNMGQLLQHLSSGCGSIFRGFVTGEWQDDSVAHDAAPAGALPPAEKYIPVKSVAEAAKRVAADRELAFEMLEKAGEACLESRTVAPPWGGPEMSLGRSLLIGTDHLKMHKAQLFYYLKLMGKPVDTFTLYGG